MHRIIAILMLLGASVITEAAAASRPEFMVRAWAADEGLPGNSARSIGTTPDGFLWVATAEGLARFDGQEFENIPATGAWRGRPLELARIFTPEDGSVWVLTAQRALFRVVNDSLECVFDENTGSSKTHLITQLFTLKGSVYLVRYDQMWQLEGNVPEKVVNPTAELVRYCNEDLSREQRRGRGEVLQPPSRLLDRDGGSWIPKGGNLVYQPPGTDASQFPVGSFSGGIEALDLLEDREGCVWAASPIYGLVRIRHRKVVRLPIRDGFYDSPVLTTIQTRDSTWWIANRNGGVDRVRDGLRRHISIISGLKDRIVCCIHEDKAGILWFATRDGSLYQWNPLTEKPEGQFADRPEISKFNSIAEDPQGRLWFGGRSKLFRWDGTNIERHDQDPLVSAEEISTLTFDSGGILYAGTTDGRILTFDGSTFSLLGNIGSSPRRAVSSILTVAPDELWASTIGAGLLLWKDGLWHRFGAKQGMPDERLTALALVGKDDFWTGSMGGILHVSRGELLRNLTHGNASPHWLHLDRSDGLPTRECVGRSQPGLFRDPSGMLWFPTTGGLAGVKPESIETRQEPPLIHLNSLEINGVARSIGKDPIRAGPGPVRLGFHYTGVSLAAPDKVSYWAKLNGFEDASRSVGKSRDIEYPNVPPGSYLFEISASNGGGATALAPAVVAIEISPHFWQTAWFAVIAGVALVFSPLAIGWSIARRRLKRKIREMKVKGMLESERSRISRDLHDDLGASLTEVSILTELVAEENHDADLRPSLDQLSLKAKRVVSSLDEIVWATNPTQDSLRSLIEYLEFFTDEFLRTVKVPFRSKVPQHIPDLNIGPRRRHSILLAAREALNNAVKHGKANIIHLRVDIQAEDLIISIQDDGRGFDTQDPACGNGLTNMHRRLQECGGECQIESFVGKGTTVTLKLSLYP